MLLYFGSLPMMPIAQVGAALFTAPIWVLLFAAAFFGRPIGPRQMLAVGLGFLGVLVMLRPDPANLSPLTLMPVAAGALYGLSNLLTREWCADEPVGALLVGFFGAMGLAGALALALVAWTPPPGAWVAAAPFLTTGWAAPTGRFLFWTFVQAAGSLLAVGMIAKGYQSGETSVLTVFEYFFLASVSFWAWAALGRPARRARLPRARADRRLGLPDRRRGAAAGSGGRGGLEAAVEALAAGGHLAQELRRRRSAGRGRRRGGRRSRRPRRRRGCRARRTGRRTRA